MKKHILSVLALAGLISLSSCSDFLDVQPEGESTTDNYFSNDQQAIDAIDALYARLQQENVFGREFFWEQGGGQDVVWGRTRGYKTLAQLTYTGDESPLRDTFTQFYNTMARSNWVISALLERQAERELTAVENRSLGEAYFLRALAHYYVAYRYGTKDQGVPFVQYEKVPGGYNFTIPPQQASVVDDYALIIEDMQEAMKYLPKVEEYDAANLGRAHKAACLGYIAKTYAYWAMWDKTQWQNVINTVNEMEKSYGRGLEPEFADLFSPDTNKFFGPEYVWSIPGYGGETPGGSEFPGVILENKGWGKYNGWGQNKPSLNLYEELAKDGTDNVRLRNSVLEYGQEFQFFGETRRFYSTSDVESGFMCAKYLQPFADAECISKGMVSANGDWPTVRVNFPLLRFADMKLLRAEAYIMMGDASKATKDINDVRTRSRLATLDHTPTMKDIYHERRCEFAFEYADALFDLKRWHLSCPELKAETEKALCTQPRVRNYEDRSNPDSKFTEGYYADNRVETGGDYNGVRLSQYDDHLLVFPYPSEVLTESNGQLKQNAGY